MSTTLLPEDVPGIYAYPVFFGAGGAIEVGQVFSFLTRLQTPLRGSTCCPAHIFRRGDDPGSLVLKGCLHKKYLYALSVRL